VNQKLQLSYKNARALHQKINRELPDVAFWSRSVIRISGINDEFELFMRDPVECIEELWANLAYLDHLTYAPEHRFADEGKAERAYDELMNGDWSWEMQVCWFHFFFGNALNKQT
jgi:hypothetical protein